MGGVGVLVRYAGVALYFLCIVGHAGYPFTKRTTRYPTLLACSYLRVAKSAQNGEGLRRRLSARRKMGRSLECCLQKDKTHEHLTQHGIKRLHKVACGNASQVIFTLIHIYL